MRTNSLCYFYRSFILNLRKGAISEHYVLSVNLYKSQYISIFSLSVCLQEKKVVNFERNTNVYDINIPPTINVQIQYDNRVVFFFYFCVARGDLDIKQGGWGSY